VPEGVISGDRWIAERLTFLRERLLDGEISDELRHAIESEIEVLRKERKRLHLARLLTF
jgi:hypothetical protein